MLINWFTVLAQIVNFLVLVALLKHFLWGRLMRAIDQRQAKIAGELADADEKRRAAQQQMEEAHALAQDQKLRCDELLAQARKEADEQRLKMIDDSRENIAELEKQWHDQLDREKAAFFKELRRRAATEILKISRQALADLASANLQRTSVDVFLQKLNAFDLAPLERLLESGPMIRTAMELPKEIQDHIRKAVEKQVGRAVPLQFTCDPAMSWGIELRVDGLKIGWTPESYLDFLEENLSAELERAPGAMAHAADD